MTERALLSTILLQASRVGARLFRNNTGQGWVGMEVHRTVETITLAHPRPLHAGLCVGSSDLIGWTPVRITADMVGQTVAVFTAVEVKTGRLQATPDQQNFIEAVRSAGGLAGVARSESDAEKIIRPPC